MIYTILAGVVGTLIGAFLIFLLRKFLHYWLLKIAKRFALVVVSVWQGSLRLPKWILIMLAVLLFGVVLAVALLTTLGPKPRLCFAPMNVVFGSALTSNTFEVWNCGVKALSWRITSEASWISVDPVSGSSAGERDTVTLTVDRSGLEPGSYTADLKIEPNYGVEQGVTIAMDVRGPELCLSATKLDFGVSSERQTIEIWNCGVEMLSWQIASEVPWISVDPISGSSSGERDVVTATVDRSGLSSDTYVGNLVIQSEDAGVEFLGVSMTVISFDQLGFEAGLWTTLAGENLFWGADISAGAKANSFFLGGLFSHTNTTDIIMNCISLVGEWYPSNYLFQVAGIAIGGVQIRHWVGDNNYQPSHDLTLQAFLGVRRCAFRELELYARVRCQWYLTRLEYLLDVGVGISLSSRVFE